MENRDAIVRKLNALRAKFEHGATSEHEATAAMDKYNELMAKYRLTETDLNVRDSGIKIGEFHTYKYDFGQLAPICWLIKPIAMVTSTKGVCYSNITGVFFGTGADVQYAEFIWRRCDDSLKATWEAFYKSPTYERFEKNGWSEAEIRTSFIQGWLQRMTARLLEMAPKMPSENALIVLKNELIEAALGEAGKTSTSNAVAKQGHNIITLEGGLEADKVRLRQEADAQTKYLGAK